MEGEERKNKGEKVQKEKKRQQLNLSPGGCSHV